MITNIWLKAQPNKKLSHPDCYPFFSNYKIVYMWSISKGNDNDNAPSYMTESINKIEFRP